MSPHFTLKCFGIIFDFCLKYSVFLKYLLSIGFMDFVFVSSLYFIPGEGIKCSLKERGENKNGILKSRGKPL